MAFPVRNAWIMSIQDEVIRRAGSFDSSAPCSMFRVPPAIRQVSDKHYDPQLIYFGLYTYDGRRFSGGRWNRMEKFKREVASTLVALLKSEGKAHFELWQSIEESLLANFIWHDLCDRLIPPESPSEFTLHIRALKEEYFDPEPIWEERPDGGALDLRTLCQMYDDAPEVPPADARLMLILDAVFLVSFLLFLHAEPGGSNAPVNPLEHIFIQPGMYCNLDEIEADMWLFENQIPLSLIRDVLDAMYSAFGNNIDRTTVDTLLHMLVVRAIKDVLPVFPGDFASNSDVENRMASLSFSECRHLLECLYRAIKAGASGDILESTDKVDMVSPLTDSIQSTELAPKRNLELVLNDVLSSDDDGSKFSSGGEIVVPATYAFRPSGLASELELVPTSNGFTFVTRKSTLGTERNSRHKSVADAEVKQTLQNAPALNISSSSAPGWFPPIASQAVSARHPSPVPFHCIPTFSGQKTENSFGNTSPKLPQSTGELWSTAKTMPLFSQTAVYPPEYTSSQQVSPPSDWGPTTAKPEECSAFGAKTLVGQRQQSRNRRLFEEPFQQTCEPKIKRRVVPRVKPRPQRVSGPSGGRGITARSKVRKALGLPDQLQVIAVTESRAERPTSKREYFTLPTATNLRKAGIAVKGDPGPGCKVEFRDSPWILGKATLYISQLRIDDHTEKYFRNLLAYESISTLDNELVTYVSCMDDLIDDEEDVRLLREGECPVITYSLVVDKDVANMFNNLLVNCTIYDKKELHEIRQRVNVQYEKKWRQMGVEFYETHCSKPWVVISILAAFVLLTLTTLQTVYSVLGYY